LARFSIQSFGPADVLSGGQLAGLGLSECFAVVLGQQAKIGQHVSRRRSGVDAQVRALKWTRW
jgi:hypothetical protein